MKTRTLEVVCDRCKKKFVNEEWHQDERMFEHFSRSAAQGLNVFTLPHHVDVNKDFCYSCRREYHDQAEGVYNEWLKNSKSGES